MLWKKTERIKPEHRSVAKAYTDSLLKYETLMTAFIYMRIFEFTRPLSKYLQTSGMELFKAQKFVKATVEE